MMRKFGFMRQVNKRVERVVKIKGLRLFAIAGTSRAGRARLVPSSRALVYRGGWRRYGCCLWRRLPGRARGPTFGLRLPSRWRASRLLWKPSRGRIWSLLPWLLRRSSL